MRLGQIMVLEKLGISSLSIFRAITLFWVVMVGKLIKEA